MELYILDALLRRETVVDKFESLIWTERFAQAGDFELVLHSTSEFRKLFVAGKRIAVNTSHRVMIVDSVENSVDSDLKATLTIKGSSIERLLEDRVAKATMSDTTTEPKWALTGTAGAIIRQIFHDICVTGTLDTQDIIPFIHEGNVLFPTSTIPEPPGTISVEIEPTTVYKAITELCVLYDLGFRLYRNLDTSALYFDVYSGSDRTTSQTTLPAVVFSPELENLQNTTEFTTTASYKNVAYVFSPVGFEIVYAEGVDPSVSGFDRRVLVVNATDITSTDGPTATAQMIQRGKEELSKNRVFSGFDGEINQSSTYKYGVAYNLGDLVEIRNADGVTTNMRVTEQIFVSDANGERSYPTLSIDLFINAGSWLSWDYNQVWSDLGTTEYWSTA